MRLATFFEANAIILASASRRGEEGVPRRIADELSALAAAKGDFLFVNCRVDTREGLYNFLDRIRESVSSGLRPILHLDMHGHKDKGLEIGATGEFAPWPSLVEKLRPINVATGNNLCVLITACHGLYLITPISIFEPTPFFALLAPQEEIRIAELEDAVGPFYRELIETRDAAHAFSMLSGKFKYFHSEKMLVVAMARYIHNYCRGRGAVKRREELLTGILRGMPNTPANRKTARKRIKRSIEPDQALLDEYARTFLAGKRSSITMAEILREIKRPGLTLGRTDGALASRSPAR